MRRKTHLYSTLIFGLGCLCLFASVAAAAGQTKARASVSAAAQAAAPQPEAAWLDGRWPHERSDLTPDPSVRFGRLDNGFRYALIPNAKPEDRVCVYLNVQAGSLMETDAQLGLAHYVEHMAFEGSRSFPPGSLIPFFQKNGMSFGGDTNAFTSREETVYTLNLATGSPENLRQGLQVLRDFADGVSFAEPEVEQERGIILAEKTVRDSEEFQAYRRYMAAMYPASRFSNMPIGEDSIIKSATSASLRALYTTWYRPERMVLVVTGVMDPAVLEPMIREAFADMRAAGPAPVVPAWGAPEHKGVRAFYDKRDVSNTMVSISAMFPRSHVSDSRALQREMLAHDLCARMMVRRLQQREQEDSSLWSGADIDLERSFGLFPTASLQAVTTGEGWEKALRALDIELRQALAKGFTQTELDESKTELVAMLERGVKERANRKSGELALQAVTSFNQDRVFMSPEQEQALFTELSAALTLDQINAAFRTAWDSGNRILYVSGNAAIKDGEKAILAAYQSMQAEALPERAVAELAAFPYLPLPKLEGPAGQTGQTVQLKQLTERPLSDGKLRILSGTLPNGVTVQLVPSSLNQDVVSAQLWFGDGMSALPEELVPTAQLAEAVLSRNGPGKLTRAESRRLFEPLSLEVGERFNQDFFSISGNAPKEQLTLLLQAIWTQFTDPTPREDALGEVRRDLALGHHDRYNTVPGVLRDNRTPFFAGPAARKRNLTEADAARLTLQDIDVAVAKTRATNKRHLVIIGDFDPAVALAQAQALFGTTPLPKPQTCCVAASMTPPLPASFPAGQTRTLKTPDTVDKAVLEVDWRRDLPPDAPKRVSVVRQLLGDILEDQLREALRQKLGAAYSPQATYQISEIRSGFALYRALVSTDVRQIEAVRTALNAVIDDLRRNGVDPALLDRVRPPLVTEWKTARGTNGYWLGQIVKEYLTGQPHTTWNDTIPDLLQSVTKADIDAEIAVAFDPAVRADLIVMQDAGAEKK